ncbi:MAG: 6-hydroxycyclohex-1-ene-1-carbonyl-CoA dehydrogenase [Candidatus Krumholzibacteriia bacterium]
MKAIDAYGYYFETAGSPLQRREFALDSPEPGGVLVRVAGCGLCHTDLSFYTGAVEPRCKPPIILGHEISGAVVAAGGGFEDLVGKNVIVPAVLPCGECDLCRAGRSNICLGQKMPGNDFDGGFASHVAVPGRHLCRVPEGGGDIDLAELSVIADAVTTPYQSLVRSKLAAGEVAIVVGVGGIGGYMVQLARGAGATVIAVDIDECKLENARAMGANHAINAKGIDGREVKKAVRELIKQNRLPKTGWKVFETSGTAPGQMTAFSLLSHAGTVAVVGFTMEKIQVRLSNVMAFDAEVFGNWGCKPEYYPDVLAEVLQGRINVKDNVELHPLDAINEILPLAMEHKLEKRVVFVP